MMPRNPRWDILFEPVKIGPVIAPNRFYQVPHASGMPSLPHVRAAMREVKAEGGWGVVCTGAVSIHPSSDDMPLPAARLWDRHDVAAHALMTDAVHRHGSLAGIELWHGGAATMNRASRIAPLSPSGIGWMSTHVPFMGNLRARQMEEGDIADFLRWYREAALRARSAGYDIVYVYAGMGYLLHEFLLPTYNRRADRYGGDVAGRCRLIREALETVKDAVGQHCAVALRISLEELRARPGTTLESEAHEVVAHLAEVPDLWDVKLDSSPTDCSSSRFAEEGSHEPVIDFVKTLTTRPVVGVGRFTSPDAMVSQIRRGVLDLIGAARPSIADPFLPKKIESGDIDDIRECIGCNICVSGDYTMTPIRCTQNPTMGEEWRKGWHPERVPPRSGDDSFLIVGAGPAGLECARLLGRRGYGVHLAEAQEQLGGRVTHEARLPGLAAWARVRDYRVNQLNKMQRVEILRGSPVTAEQILEFGAQRVVLATGSRWRRDGIGRTHRRAIPGFDLPGQILTPDDLIDGANVQGPVVVFDDDHYYMAALLAEQLRRQGFEVTLVTPADRVSAWTINTLEQHAIHKQLLDLDATILLNRNLVDFDGSQATLECTFTGRHSSLPASSIVTVTSRLPNDALAEALNAVPAKAAAAGIVSVTSIGDCYAPSTIAAAVYAGHRHAREFDWPESDAVGFGRELPSI